LGEESTADETFSATEQAIVSFYLAQGNRLFFSGAEVGWDLDNLGTASDRSFYRNVLGHQYVSDDAQNYFTMVQSTGPLAGLPPMMFDDGSNGIYDVDYPDVVTASAGSNSQVVLRYANGLTAGLLSGNGRVLGLGFPMEALVDPQHRALLMERVLRTLCPLAVQPAVPVFGQPLDVAIAFPFSANGAYLVGAALADQPGIPLPTSSSRSARRPGTACSSA
jgi:hypothetical protein